MTDKTEKRLFILLRASLWDHMPDFSEFENMIDAEWQSVYNMARSQALIGVIFDGVMKLPKNLQPSRMIVLTWYMNVEKIAHSNEQMNNSIKVFTEEMRQLGVDYILIKGQSLATLYPNKLRRQSGDVDIVVKDRKQYDIIYDYLCGKTGTNPKFNVKHVTFSYLNTDFEIHKDIMNLHNPFRKRKLEKKITSLVCSGDSELCDISGESVTILPPLINAVYILKHAFDHLVTFGVGLRQVCDWTVFMKAHKDILDKDEVTNLLKLCSIYDAANMFGYVAVHYLGINKEDLPFNYNENKELGEFLYRDIMAGGNFGTYRKGYNVNRNPVLRKTNTAFSIFKRSIMFFKFSPNESLWFPVDQIYRVSIAMLRSK